MATLITLTLDVEDSLYGNPQIERPAEDTLNTAVTSSSDTSWRFDTYQMWKRGDRAEYVTTDGTAGEIVVLAADHASGADVTVRRAQKRTTAASAYSIGDVFRKNPLYDRTMIARAINETIDSDLAPEAYYRATRQITLADGKKRYDLNASDFEVDQVYQTDTQQTSVGAATFDVTGGASEDLWTRTAYGLAVGDPVRFTAVGTGAEPYAIGVPYWVATVPTANTFQLSATDSTTVLEGTGTDTVGTWTLAKIVQFEYIPFNPALYEVATNQDTTTATQSGVALRLKSWYSVSDALYVTTRVKPSSSAISSLPTELADMVPFGAMARLLSWVPVPARSDLRRTNRVGQGAGASQPFIDAQFYAAKFEEHKRRYKRKLQRDLLAPRKYRTNRVWSG